MWRRFYSNALSYQYTNTSIQQKLIDFYLTFENIL